MPRDPRTLARGAISMALLLGVTMATLLAVIVGVIAYATNYEVTHIFDRSARDSRELAMDNMSRFTELLASNTAVTVRPSVLDHNYSYIRDVLTDMTRKDDNLLYIAVLDSDGEVIEDSGRRVSDGTAAIGARAPITFQRTAVGTVELQYSMHGVDARIREAQAENHAERSASIRTLLIGGGIVLGIGVLIAAAFGVSLARPVTRMAGAAGELGEGKFDVRVTVDGPTELRQLATTFNAMASELQASVEATIERAALEREVATARRLQRDMMPPNERIVAGDIEIASWYEPAGKMAGDWWTVSQTANDSAVTVMIGDVIGHGIPAALFTAAAKSAYRAAGALGADATPDRILATMDQALRGFAETHTMTGCAMRLDPSLCELVMAIGGHPSPLRFHRVGDDRAMEVLEGYGPLLGDPRPDAAFASSQHRFQPGDLIVLFTDGLIEATDSRNRMFGLRRLGAAIEAHVDDDLETILAEIKRALSSYVASDELDDDVTVILIRHMRRERRATS